MTFDKATYTIRFDQQDVPVAEWYASEAREHANGETVRVCTETRDDGYTLIVTVHGDGYAISVWEEQFRDGSLPTSARIDCNVDIGGAER